VTGYFKVSRAFSLYICPFLILIPDKNAARMMPDGTYRSAREGAVSRSIVPVRPSSGTVRY